TASGSAPRASTRRRGSRRSAWYRRKATDGCNEQATMSRRRPQRARSLLARLQLGLEALYRVETRLTIDAFVIDDDARERFNAARAPREQLLLREDDGELGMALFVDAAALANLERHDPGACLDDHNFSDFCLAVEGV